MEVAGMDLTGLKTFRDKLYRLLPKRRDALLELLDALSSNLEADSVVKLSLNDRFRRTYNSVRDAISNFLYDAKEKTVDLNAKQALKGLIMDQIPLEPSPRNFFCLGRTASVIPAPLLAS